MEKSLAYFLGKTERSRTAEGCHIALNSYGVDNSFEEWHSHKNASISFLLNGTHQEDFQSGSLQRQPGDIKFIPAGERHRCTNYTADTRKINIELPDAVLRKMEITPDQVECLIRSAPQVRFTFLKFFHELEGQSDTLQASLQLLLYELLKPCRVGWDPEHRRKLPLWVIQLRELLRDEFDKPLNLENIASRLSVHPVTISRYFPHYFNQTLSRYVRDLKVNKALTLIKKTKLSLTDIAFECGFTDQSHFTHTFKAATGYLPKEFRRI